MSKSHLSLTDIFPRLREAVTGRRDNVVHLHPPEAEPLIDDVLDDLDRAKVALLEHVDAIPALRDAGVALGKRGQHPLPGDEP